MSKMSIVYWSGTSSTEPMTGEAGVLSPAAFSADKLGACTLGCPAIGGKELEEEAGASIEKPAGPA